MITLEKLFKKPFTPASGIGVGVAFFQNHFSVAYLKQPLTKTTPAAVSLVVDVSSGEALFKKLSETLDEYRLRSYPITFILDKPLYQLEQIDAPEVEPSEMREAIKWRLKDVLNYSAEEAIFDYYPLYETPPPGTPHWLYLASVKKADLFSLNEFVEKENLKVSGYDIPEMALRNWVPLFASKSDPVAFLQLEDEETFIYFFQNDRLFFSREINQGLNVLANSEQGDQWDSFVLEIQRSLDYFESRFREPPLGHLFVLPTGNATNNIINAIRQRASVNVDKLDIKPFISSQFQLNPRDEYALCLALGGALEAGKFWEI